MKRREFLKTIGSSAIALALGNTLMAKRRVDKPNIVYMMLDEIGYFELSCLGHKILKTPNLDRLAAEGMRFTQCLAGAPVCAPTRCVLLTGKHTGHCQVRVNGGGLALTTDEFTLGEMFKSAGYATGGFGKWGIGDTGTTGVPERHGFDIFYGYYHQVHAHSYYPEFLIRNGKREMLEGNTGDYHTGKTFSHYLIHKEALQFMRQNKDRPRGVFEPNATVFRGGKGNLLEGGLRVPYLVRWPGKIKAGSVTGHLCYFADVMPTLAQASGAKIPTGIDGISFLPTLRGEGKQQQHDFLYWEYQGQVAVRKNNWKAFRSKKQPWRLFNLDIDSREQKDLASQHPEILQEMIAYATSAHSLPKAGSWIDPSQKFTRPKKK
jgi:arylsulfatase A-like enzyme